MGARRNASARNSERKDVRHYGGELEATGGDAFDLAEGRDAVPVTAGRYLASMTASEDLFVALQVIVRRTDRVTAESLMDAIFEFVGPCHPDGCTCGLESMGGLEAGLDDCYRFIGVDPAAG